VNGRDHRLAEILDEIEHPLSKTTGLLCFERGEMRELADIRAGNEGFAAGTCENGAADRRVVARILERRSQILRRRRVQGVEHLWTIDRHVGDVALLLVQDICEL